MKGLRFQKRIKVAPGVRLNLSKSGVSTSLGGPGASLNIGKKGVKSTVGLPGTGLSYSSQLGKGKAQPAPLPEQPSTGRVLAGLGVLVLICAAIWLAL